MTLKLSANLRTDLGKKSVHLREAGKIPAVIYGHKFANVNLEFGYNEFEKILNEAGESTIIDVAVAGQEPLKAIISEVRYDPLSSRIIHADLHQVNMNEKINANVEITFSGESKAVKEDGAVIIHGISEVEVRCLPADLPHEINVDIGVLEAIDDAIKIKDLNLSSAVEILHHEPEDVVAIVARPKEEKEEVPVVAPVEGEVIEGAAVAGEAVTAIEQKDGKNEKKKDKK